MVVDLIICSIVGGKGPQRRGLSYVSEGAIVMVLDRTLPVIPPPGNTRKKAYKQLFEKMAEDVGIVRRNCEGLW